MILAGATIWDVLLDVFCSCVRDLYSPCPYGSCVVCLVFRKLYLLGATVEHSEERDVKLTWAKCFFKNLTVTFLYASPVEITMVFPPTKHALQNSESLKAFAPKVRTSAVIVGPRSKDLHIFIDCTFRAGIPHLLLPIYHFSIPTHEHVLIQHFDRWTVNMYP